MIDSPTLLIHEPARRRLPQLSDSQQLELAKAMPWMSCGDVVALCRLINSLDCPDSVIASRAESWACGRYGQTCLAFDVRATVLEVLQCD